MAKLVTSGFCHTGGLSFIKVSSPCTSHRCVLCIIRPYYHYNFARIAFGNEIHHSGHPSFGIAAIFAGMLYNVEIIQKWVVVVLKVPFMQMSQVNAIACSTAHLTEYSTTE